MHMITDQDKFRKLINNLRIGDQVYIKGLLISYQQSGWGDFWRTSSVIDGTSHCKIIFLQDVKVLARGNSGWNLLYEWCKWILVISLALRIVVYFMAPL